MKKLILYAFIGATLFFLPEPSVATARPRLATLEYHHPGHYHQRPRLGSGPRHSHSHRPPHFLPPIYQPPPGWFGGSPWDGGLGWRPDWFLRDLLFPQFNWMGPRFPGLWQCNSFVYSPQQNMWWSFYGTGPNQDVAAFNALFACGGHYFMQNECYIPPGYCRL